MTVDVFVLFLLFVVAPALCSREGRKLALEFACTCGGLAGAGALFLAAFAVPVYVAALIFRAVL